MFIAGLTPNFFFEWEDKDWLRAVKSKRTTVHGIFGLVSMRTAKGQYAVKLVYWGGPHWGHRYDIWENSWKDKPTVPVVLQEATRALDAL